MIGVLKRKVLLNVKKRLTVTRVVTGASHVSVKCEKLMAGSVHCAHVQEINKLNGHTARTKANLVYEANLGLTPESKTSGGGRPPSEPGRASQHSTHTQATDNSSEHVHLPWNMPVRTSFEHVAGGASKKLSSVKPN